MTDVLGTINIVVELLKVQVFNRHRVMALTVIDLLGMVGVGLAIMIPTTLRPELKIVETPDYLTRVHFHRYKLV